MSRRGSSPLRRAATGTATGPRAPLPERPGLASGRDQVGSTTAAFGAQSTLQPSTGMNKDLLESVMSVSESAGIGAAQKDAMRAFVAEATSTAYASPGLDEKPVRDGKPNLTARKASASGASAAKSGGRPKGAGQDTAKKARGIPSGKYSSDQVDKIYEYERENTALKSKQNLLEAEIEKMNTKLTRINELMARTNKGTREGNRSLIPAEVQRHLQDEVNKLTSENDSMRDKNKKLRAIEKELTAKSITKKASTNKYAHVKGKLSAAKVKQSERDFERLLEELKVQLIAGEKQIMHLTTQRDQLQQRLPSESHSTLQAALEGQQRELADVNRRIAEVKNSQHEKESVFNNAKEAMEKKQQEIQELSKECENLAHRNFKVNMRAQQANDLKDTLKEIELERDKIDEKITRLTSLPFLESSKSGEQAVQHSIARLRVQVQEATRVCEERQVQEQGQLERVNALKEEVLALKGESKYMREQHEDVTQKYAAAHGGLSLGAVDSDLKKMDDELHQRTIDDLLPRSESRPVWNGVEFTEGADGEALDPLRSDDVKVVKRAVAKLKQENRLFASELEKTQTLLNLQKDIESETTKYLQEEQRRLELLAQQSSLKAEEVSKKISGQAKLIEELEEKLGHSKPGAKDDGAAQLAPGQERFAHGEPADALSDFSADEQLVRSGENLFDLKILDGELDVNAILRLLSWQGGKQDPELTTLVTVDFLAHETRATPATPGSRPQYGTHFTFVDKMDEAYVQHLRKAGQTLEIWLLNPGSGRQLRLGVCEFRLAMLAAELPGMPRPATVSERLMVRPSPELVAQQLSAPSSIGHLRIKMRLREPISAAFENARVTEQVAEVTREAHIGGRPGTSGPRACLVTICVAQAHDLKVASGRMAQVAPFYYYQFHTFDEKYSEASTGSSPVFGSRDSYPVTLDEPMRRYLKAQTLDIAFFDDNAPVSGLPGGAQSNAPGEDVDDLIGVCKVPLADLAEGTGINADFPVRGLRGTEAGTARVRITIVDATTGQEIHRKQTEKEIEQHRKGAYNDQWEAGIIQKIATKLSRRIIDIELMFGIFSSGAKACTREDFKYTCLQKLKLKDELSDRELEMFLSQHPRLRDKATIDQHDFKEIFSEAILKARNAALNKEAEDPALLARYRQQMQESTRRASQSTQYRGTEGLSLVDFQRKDAINVLMKALKTVSAHEINKEVALQAQKSRIAPDALRKLLYVHGGAADHDTRKITDLLTSQDPMSSTAADPYGATSSISVVKFAELLDEARLEARFSSPAVSKFNHLIQVAGKQLAECFLQKDINKDGAVNVDGFKASVIDAGIVDDHQLARSDLLEIFNLISVNGMLKYGEYMVEQDRRTLQYLPATSRQQIEESAGLGESSRTLEPVASQFGATGDPGAKSKPQATTTTAQALSTRALETRVLAAAKEKIERFLVSQDVTLSMLFSVIDTNSDDLLSRPEFSRKLTAMQAGLEPEEVECLFKHLDANKDGSVSYGEFVQAFSAANADQIVNRMRRVLYQASMSVKELLSRHCTSGTISKAEFRKIVRALIDKLADFEIDSVFKELAKSADAIAREDFLDIFGRDEQEKQFQTGIEDILKPLGTYMRKQQVSLVALFREHDQDRNTMMSAEELAAAVQATLKYQLTQEEIGIMRDFFRARFRRAEVNRAQFDDILNTPWVRKWESKPARAALGAIQAKLKEQGRQIDAVLGPDARFKKDQVPLRAFKRAIYQLGAVTQQQVNNLAKYMDRYDDGMIRIPDVKAALGGRYDPRKASVAGSASR